MNKTLLNYEDGYYALIVMDKNDIRSLHAMIKSACLPQRREWNGIKQQIENILNT